MRDDFPECLRGTDVEKAHVSIQEAQVKVDCLTVLRDEMKREFGAKKSERAAEIDITFKTDTLYWYIKRKA